MLLQVRRLALLALCRGINFAVRWIPRELNVADGGSRQASSAVSPSGTILGKRRMDVLEERTDVWVQESQGGVTDSSPNLMCVRQNKVLPWPLVIDVSPRRRTLHAA